jgi:cytochrome P450
MSTLYDPADPSFAERALSVYRTMRDEQPLYVGPDGAFYALSRYDDVRHAAVDWHSYSSTGKAEVAGKKPTLNSMDPPAHTEFRALVARGFTPRSIAELEPVIRDMATGLIDGFVDAGRCDVAAEFAQLLPSMVMARLLGLPDDLVPVCRELTDASKRRVSAEGGNDAANRSYAIFTDLYEQRREAPTDDLLTALLQAEVGGRRLTQDELLGFSWLLLVGGNDTTTNLIANGIELLARFPDQRAALLDDRGLIPNAVEEMLRFASPTHTLPRRATRDIEVAGGVIPENARVLLVWSAANHDEREFADPDVFDVRRDAGRHLAFGTGTHFCLGAALARLEARIAFEELLRRIPEFAVDGAPERLVSSVFTGWERLPLRYGPSRP